MEKLQEEWSNYTRLIKMIAEQFGSRCEVILHDLTQSYDHTIVTIENGHITNRKVGDCGSNLGLQVLSGNKKEGDIYNYITQTRDGKILRSSTTYIRNGEGQVIGAICINYDITDLIMADNILRDITMYSVSKNDVEQEVFASNVGEILDHLISMCQVMIGKPSSMMTKADKIKAIDFFDKKGAFLITKAGERICEYLGISKFTLYSYLEMARAESAEEQKDKKE